MPRSKHVPQACAVGRVPSVSPHRDRRTCRVHVYLYICQYLHADLSFTSEPDVLDEASTEVAPSVLQTSAGRQPARWCHRCGGGRLALRRQGPAACRSDSLAQYGSSRGEEAEDENRRNILAVLLLQPVRVLNLASTAEASVPRMPSRIWMSSWRNPYGLLECRHDRTCPTYWVRISDSDIH